MIQVKKKQIGFFKLSRRVICPQYNVMELIVFFLKAFQKTVQQRYYLVETASSNRFIIEETMNDILVGTINPEKFSP